jgi:hypothetical protein
MNWISIEDRLPENEQEVLTVKDCEIPDYTITTYFTKGTMMDYAINAEIQNPEKRLLDSIFNPENEVIAQNDGFYIYENEGWRLLKSSHWMPLPKPPKNIRKTNFDKIKEMDLVSFLVFLDEWKRDCPCCNIRYGTCAFECEKEKEKWLESEV